MKLGLQITFGRHPQQKYHSPKQRLSQRFMQRCRTFCANHFEVGVILARNLEIFILKHVTKDAPLLLRAEARGGDQALRVQVFKSWPSVALATFANACLMSNTLPPNMGQEKQQARLWFSLAPCVHHDQSVMNWTTSCAERNGEAKDCDLS